MMKAKKTYIYRLLLVVLAVGAVLMFAGCGGEDTEIPTGKTDGDMETESETNEATEQEQAQEYVDCGRDWIEKAEPTKAKECFAQALDADPNNLQAHFGYAFAESQTVFELLMSTITILTQTGNGKPEPWPDDDEIPPLYDNPAAKHSPEQEYESQSDYIATEVHRIFGIISERLNNANEHYQQIINSEEKDEFVFTIDSELPIYMGLDKLSWMKGEVRIGDVYVFKSVAEFFQSITILLSGLDLHGDLINLVNRVQSQGLNAKNDIGALIKEVVGVLISDDRFLSFYGGKDAGKAAAEQINNLWLSAIQDIINAAQAVEEQGCTTDDSVFDNHIFYCFEDKYSHERELRAHIFKKDEELGDPDTGILMMNVVVLAMEDTEVLNTFAQNLSAPTGEPLVFRDTLLPALSSFLALSAGYGLFDFIGFDLGLGDAITPDVIASFLKTIIPKGLALDFGTFWRNPASLREVLPMWTTDRPRGQNDFYAEWECPSELEDNGYPNGKGSLLCEANDECADESSTDCLRDSAHFVGTEYEQPADGIALGSPYFVWQNPDMNGLMYINPCKIGLDAEECSYEPATQETLNIYMGKVINSIMRFIGNSNN